MGTADMSQGVYSTLNEPQSTLRDRLETARMRCGEMYDDARDRLSAGARSADEVVHTHPYYAMAAALGVGVLIGFLIGRRGGDSLPH